MKTKSLIYISLAVALITIGAFIKVPISLVPITLQPMMVILIALILPKKDGFKACIIYLVIGLIGFPIFANGGGIAYVLVPSFGYLLGFCFAALFIAQFKKDQFIYNLIISLIGLLIIYSVGVFYFIVLEYFYYQKVFSINWLFYYLFMVYIPGDIITLVIANIIHQRLKYPLNKALS